MTTRATPRVLLERLIMIGDQLTANRATQISDATLRAIREEVATERLDISDEPSIVGYEAGCLVECIAELAYARSERDANREDRAKCYINSFLTFMRADLARAVREGVA